MKKVILLLAALALITLVAGCHSNLPAKKTSVDHQKTQHEAIILQSWQGNFPIEALDRLPEDQSTNRVGYIGDAETFAAVWKSFKPGEKLPIIDFSSQLVLFVRNTQFYNRVSIGRVNVSNGLAEVLAMETMSAMPIENKVAMSLAVVPCKGISAVRSEERIIPIQADKLVPE
jgi:hypothetical protein